MIVADTNLIAYLLLPGEHTADARVVFDHDPAWAAPLLWRSELLNVLALYLRRGALDLGDASSLIRDAEDLVGERQYRVDGAHVLELTKRSSCSAYDCEFVATAELLGVPLITSDRKVLAAFERVAQHPREWLSAEE